jgi:hypothetical protein
LTTRAESAQESKMAKATKTTVPRKGAKLVPRKGAKLTKSSKAPAKTKATKAGALLAGRPTATLPKGEHVKLVATCQNGETWITGRRWVCGIEGTSPKRTGIVFWKYRNRTAQEIVGHASGYTWGLDAPDVVSPAHKRVADRAARKAADPAKPRQAKAPKGQAKAKAKPVKQESLSPEELSELHSAPDPGSTLPSAKPPTDPSDLLPGDRVRVPERLLNGVKLASFAGEVVTVTTDSHGPVIHVRTRNGAVRLARFATRTRKAAKGKAHAAAA